MTERPRMNTGDIAYMSGWPVHQNEGQREYGALERQEWAMVFLGYGDVEISSGEYLLDVATFALQSTEDDAECSFGASGSFAVTEFGDHIGALAGFNDLKIGANITNQYDADYVKNSNEQKFGVNLDGFDAICHFTPPINSSNPNQYEILEIREAHESAEVVAEVAERALEDLFDPSTESTYIDGVFEGLLGQKGGPGTLAYVENPVLYTDEQTGHSMLHWSEANEEGMSYTFIPQGDEKTFFFSSERSDGVDNSFVKTKGQISIEGGKFDPNGAYVDNNGVRFGDLRADIPVDNSEFYILSISPDGNTVFQPRVL